jgi:phosphoribosylaminoimidazole-succinocarboxamide synthase
MSYPPPPPTSIPIPTLGEASYLGSVQHLYPAPGHPAYLVSQTTEAGSVFDVGSIFRIPGNDIARATFRHVLYSNLGKPQTWQHLRRHLQQDSSLDSSLRQELLTGPLESMCESGASTHHIGMLDADTGTVTTGSLPAKPSPFNVIRRFPVIHPPQRQLLGGYAYDYAQFHQSDTYVIPLEYIVRFGVTSGSSILRLYENMSESARQSYLRELGLSQQMQPWKMLDRPIFDLTSKYEPEDRNVSKQEAMLMSGLSSQHFLDSIKMAILGGYVVKQTLAPIGLLLWDLKWEFAVDRQALLFVDTIDNDSFRATRFMEVSGQRIVIHYNKQAMRDYYRILHSTWYSSLNTAKLEAKHSGRPFKEILKQGQQQGIYPETPAADPAFLDIQSRKSQLISQHLLHPENAQTIAAELEACGQQEIDYYRKHQRLDALIKVNAA